MSIQQGDPIPNVKVFELDQQGAARAMSAAERFAGKRIVLFAVPGAFTRTCSQVHLPSFVQNADAIKAKGIDAIVCLPWANAAFADKLGAQFNILSDAKRDVSRAYGVFDEQNAIARRTTFVIDRQGIVKQIFMAQEALDPTHALEACALLTEVK
jgi:peroxiredoxin